MNTTVEVVYQSALLADAAYVSLHATDFVRAGDIQLQAWDQDADNPSQVETFLDRGFTFQQFLKFREDYSVLHHQPDTLTGFSATLFQNRHTGELHLAFRGSNELADYAQNIDLAVELAERLGSELQHGAVRDFLRDAGIMDAVGAIKPEYLGRINLTGHSLGGHLALWTATEYPSLVARVDTFNGAGLEYGNPLSVLAESFLRDNLSGNGALDTGRVHNWYAERGIEVVASAVIAYRPGEHLPLFIEDRSLQDGSSLSNHGMQSLVATLSAYRLFSALDPSLGIADITTLLEGSSNGGVGGIANATIALGDALGEAYAGIADPVALHALLAEEIAQGRWSGLRIEVLAGREDLAATAVQDSTQGSAYRFALEHLHAFAVVCAEAASAAIALDTHSQEYLEHRAYLLQSLLLRNEADSAVVVEQGRGPEVFADLAHGLEFTSSQAALPFPAAAAAQWRFGAATNDSLAGGTRRDALFGMQGDDQLYGGAADDVLEGGQGNDWLLGGDGADTLGGGAGDDQLFGGDGNDSLCGGQGADSYIFETAEGTDLIVEADNGGDRIVIDSIDLANLRYEASAPGSSRYRAIGGWEIELRITDGGLAIQRGAQGAGAAVMMASWQQGDFGIVLPGSELLQPGTWPVPASETTILGDRAPLDTDPAHDGVQTGYDALGNLLVDPLRVEARDDTLNGSTGNDLIDGGEGADGVRARAGDDHVLAGPGADWLEGEAGNDLLEGGSGSDVLHGGDGADRLEGGEDTDILAGGSGDDELHAGSGAEFVAVRDATLLPASTRDWLSGGSGNDTLVGSSGNEGLAGGGGADRIVAGSGDDQLLGDAEITVSSFAWNWSDDPLTARRVFSPASGTADPADGGADTLYGGDGADWIAAGRGADEAFGEAGDDELGGDAGNDTLDGGEGNDLLVGDAQLASLEVALHGNDQLQGGAGNDSLYGNGGADLLLGGEGADLLSGDSSEQDYADQRADTLDGGSGNDTLSGAGGADLLGGGDGDDLISADGGADTIDGGAGNDRIWGDSSTLVALDDGADRVHGGTGEDQLVGGGGDDTLDGGADDDALWGAAGNDELRGGAGDDQLTAGDGDDLLAGNAGDDLMWGEAGNDTLHGGEGLDVVQGQDGNDWLHGGADADTLIGGAGSDVLIAGSGNDEAGGGAGDDSLEGGDGADLVYGDGENDQLLGGNGNDGLHGDAGNDTLDGGAGDDLLDGGAGDDTFVLHTFAGNDTLVGGGGTTTLVFAGAAAPPVILAEHTWGSQTVALVLAGTRVELSVAEYRQLADLRTDAGAFAGSDIVRTSDGLDRVQLPGTADTLFARGGTDTVHGGDGDDALHGDAGHDQLRGENGADTLAGGDGMDSLYGGAHADTLSGDASLDTLWGEDGDDTLDGGAGTDTLWGGDGNDVLAGGAGGDTLDGGAGNDTYHFDVGAEIEYLSTRAPVTGELDTVQFGAGISPGSLTLRSHGGNDLHLERAGGDTLIVESFFADLARLPNLQFRFSDDPDTVWSAADVLQRMALPATEGPDARDGFGGNDSLAGLGGADTLFGGAGDDTLSGGDDADDIGGGEGHDLLQGDAGADTLDGGTGNDQLLGGAGDDALIAGDGSDTLDGGTGADRLEGGSGADTYHYRRGDGNEVVVELDGRTAGTLFIDVLRLGPGIAAADVQIAPVLQDFSGYMGSSGFRTSALATELRITGDGSIRILEPADTVNFYSRIDELRFDDAPQSVVSWNQLYGDLTTADEGHDFLQGTTNADVLDARGGDDLVFGSAGADSLAGGSGSDTLFGGSAGDTLDGGAGADFLRGGDEGSPSSGYGDVLVWGRGYGHDTAWTRPDSQFWVYASSGEPYPADELRLNGVAWSELRALREGDDLALYLEGTADRFTVLGYFASGHQQVRIANGSGGFYLLADVERKIAETAILAQVSTGDDHVVGTDAAGESIDALAGNDLVEGRGGNDTLYGGDGNDTLDGGAGNDTLAGGLGNDTYRFGFGGGSDRVLDQDKTTGRIDTVLMDTTVRADDVRIARIADDLVLTLADSGEAITVAKHFTTKGKDVGFNVDAVRFADGSEWNRTTLLDYVNRSANGHYTLYGSAAADGLAGLGGNDTLQGFAGNDTLTGGAGDDRLLGGAGNDALDGGKGADRYELLPGDGVDLLMDGDASARLDVLAFGTGIDPATTTAYRDGADLVLRYGAADAVRVRDFYVDGTGPGRGVEEIRFADGTLWQRASLQAAGPLPANQPPVAGDDASSLVENGTHAMSTTMLLANDGDVDGDALSVSAVRSGFGGTPVLDAATGTVRFTPQLYYTGNAWFAYTLSDGTQTTEGRVNLQVAIDTGTGARLGTEGADTLAGTRGDDRLYGLGGNDVLRADRGNDRLHGGTGNDTLEGAAGNDIYVFHRGDGSELVDNRSARSTDVDALYFTAGFARDELWFMREANDLLIGVVGSEDRVLVDEWFGAETSRLDRIHVPGSLIYAAEVEQLVHAMAAFDAPIGAGAVMSSDTRAALEPLLAATWQPSGP